MADFVFRSNRSNVLKAVKSAIDVGMEAVAAQGEANAKHEITVLVYDTPPSPSYVRTGALRNSIAHKYVSSENTAYIGTNIEYAPYVEFGTSKMRERPFLRNACSKYTKQYQSILENALKNL